MPSIEKFKDFLGFNNSNSTITKLNMPPDTIVQMVLDSSQRICLGMIGKKPTDTPPDTPTFEEAVYFFARYLIETMSKNGRQTDMEMPNFIQDKVVNPGIEDKKIHEGVMRILTGLLSQDRDVTLFMPPMEQTT